MAQCETPVALVTGSARGIGRGIALRLARDGFLVVVHGVAPFEPDADRGGGEVLRAIEAAGGQAVFFRADVSLETDRQALVEFVDLEFGRIDLLVNNAGVAPRQRADLLDATLESYDRVMDVNLRGPYFLTQAVARRMVAWQRRGRVETSRIAFVTSISAYTSSPTRGEYCVSKAGLSMAAKLFADRLAEDGIPVVEIAPGLIETDMTRAAKATYDVRIADGLLPTKRWGCPDDVAKVVSAFARGDLDYATGQRIEVGGGFGLRRL